MAPLRPQTSFIHWRITSHVSCALRRTAAVSRALGNAKPLLVKTLPTPLVGSGWCLVRKISPPLDMLAINDATDNAEQRAAIITKLADHMRRYGER